MQCRVPSRVTAKWFVAQEHVKEATLIDITRDPVALVARVAGARKGAVSVGADGVRGVAVVRPGGALVDISARALCRQAGCHGDDVRGRRGN
eukprot:2204405-Rhodomonas_salina.4